MKFNMLRETSVTMVVLSMGVDNYTQEHLDICSCLQPVFIDNFLNILSENSSDRAFDLPSPKSKQEPNSKRNKDNAEPFQTFNEVTINYIIKRSTAPTAKSPDRTALPNSSASIRVPLSKIRKYRIDVKGLERE